MIGAQACQTIVTNDCELQLWNYVHRSQCQQQLVGCQLLLSSTNTDILTDSSSAQVLPLTYFTKRQCFEKHDLLKYGAPLRYLKWPILANCRNMTSAHLFLSTRHQKFQKRTKFFFEDFFSSFFFNIPATIRNRKTSSKGVQVPA